MAFPFAFLAAGVHVGVLAVGALLAGVSMMLGNAVWESTLMRHVPGEALSRVSAYDWFGSIAFQPLGMVIWGPIAALIGIAPALWVACAAVVAATAALLATPAVRALRDDSPAHSVL
jgi:hypothetical protein